MSVPANDLRRVNRFRLDVTVAGRLCCCLQRKTELLRLGRREQSLSKACLESVGNIST